MEKLLHRIQTPPIYPMGQPPPPPPQSAQLSGQEPIHAPPLSSAWAHAPPPVNLTAHPIRFYASSPVQPSHPFGHPSSHAPPDNNLQNCQICTAVQICPSTLYINLSAIGTGLTNTITDCGLKWVSHRHPPTDLPMYSKNLVILLPNVPSNYITNSVAFSAQSLTRDNEKPIFICDHCKKQRHTKDRCWKLHGRPPRGNKRSSKEQQNLGRIDVRETASTSQPIGPTA
uniref:UBN2_3 domain-containing protein n=1 Tax=Cucumis melo TaxID=3656 RepID=A0A9I9E9J3_CUCME